MPSKLIVTSNFSYAQEGGERVDYPVGSEITDPGLIAELIEAGRRTHFVPVDLPAPEEEAKPDAQSAPKTKGATNANDSVK